MASQATLNKYANALITQFIKEYTEKYGQPPLFNRFRAKWGFQDMYSDLGYDRSKEVIEYYFRTAKVGHPVEFLHSNYDRIASYMDERKADDERREKLRAITKERVEGANG